MGLKICPFGFTGGIISAILVSNIWFQILCHGQNLTENAGSNSEIDYETLSIFGFTHELADQFRINLIKAIEAAKDEADPLRQGAYGGVSGGFYQGGGDTGGGGGGGNNQEEEEEEEDQGPTTQGPGAFGVLSGLFGIFSGLAGLNPSRIVQSTVNFFPPGQRMRVQTVVDSLIGYTPPENRTSRPRPRRPTTPMVITDMMMKEVTEAASSPITESPAVVQKGGETNNEETIMPTSNNSSSSMDLAMSEVVEAAPVELSTTTQGFLNVHKLLEKNTNTTPSPPQDEDDENDFEKGEKVATMSITEKPKYNSSMAVYKLKIRAPPEQQVDAKGVIEEDAGNEKNNTALSNATIPSTKLLFFF